MKIEVLNYVINITIKTKPKYNRIGINNDVIGTNKYIVFLDYDKIPFWEVKENIQKIQEKYDLGTAYIFKTTNGFHAYILNAVTKKELLNILFDAKEDNKHSFAIFYKEDEPANTLRINAIEKGDIVFYDKVIRKNSKPISKAHYLFLKNVLDAPVEPEREDFFINNNTINFVMYSQEK